MTIFTRALAGVAAAGLMLSQSATAAPVADSRVGAPVAQAEGLGGSSAATPALAVLAIFIAVGLVLLLDSGDDDESPTSP
jgi:hypothetical protein